MPELQPKANPTTNDKPVKESSKDSKKKKKDEKAKKREAS
jgi:hypothetical protein